MTNPILFQGDSDVFIRMVFLRACTYPNQDLENKVVKLVNTSGYTIFTKWSFETIYPE